MNKPIKHSPESRDEPFAWLQNITKITNRNGQLLSQLLKKLVQQPLTG